MAQAFPRQEDVCDTPLVSKAGLRILWLDTTNLFLYLSILLTALMDLVAELYTRLPPPDSDYYLIQALERSLIL